jgi:long-chain acyl-CoA synthetase
MEKTILHLLWNIINTYPEKPAFLYKKEGKYEALNYREVGEKITDLTHGLVSLGLKPADRLAILSYNRPEWPICDFAIFSLRGVSVPIYHTLPPAQVRYILNDSEARVVFVENELQLNKIREVRKDCPELKFIILLSGSSNEQVIPWNQILQAGAAHRQKHPDFYQNNLESIDPKETCSIVYTSGTTGNPKGVMLHHHGFVLDLINSEAVFGLYPEDVFLSFLPLSHLYERLGGHWCPLYRGATIGYAEDITTVIDDIQQVRPTVMVSVPRLYEKISNAVTEQVESGSALKRKIFHWALKTGRRYQQKKRENRMTFGISLKNKLADRLVFSKVKQKLGGNFRFPISGGAPLSTETLKFFEAMGLQIIEGYGMTETHLIITLTPPGSTKYGSCGKPIPGVEVKIDADGEILVRGETIMAGYYKQPEQTKEMIDQDGWLHTGDIGYLDQDDYLYITDRKKNIIITAGGKNVAPAPIENTLKLSRFIEDVCVIGDRRKFISAIIIPNYENLKKWAQENSLNFSDQYELVQSLAVSQMMSQEIERVQAETARFEKIKKFILLPEPLTIEQGELTPSLKIKRTVLEERLKKEIDDLYRE